MSFDNLRAHKPSRQALTSTGMFPGERVVVTIQFLPTPGTLIPQCTSFLQGRIVPVGAPSPVLSQAASGTRRFAADPTTGHGVFEECTLVAFHQPHSSQHLAPFLLLKDVPFCHILLPPGISNQLASLEFPPGLRPPGIPIPQAPPLDSAAVDEVGSNKSSPPPPLADMPLVTNHVETLKMVHGDTSNHAAESTAKHESVATPPDCSFGLHKVSHPSKKDPRISEKEFSTFHQKSSKMGRFFQPPNISHLFTRIETMLKSSNNSSSRTGITSVSEEQEDCYRLESPSVRCITTTTPIEISDVEEIEMGCDALAFEEENIVSETALIEVMGSFQRTLHVNHSPSLSPRRSPGRCSIGRYDTINELNQNGVSLLADDVPNSHKSKIVGATSSSLFNSDPSEAGEFCRFTPIYPSNSSDGSSRESRQTQLKSVASGLHASNSAPGSSGSESENHQNKCLVNFSRNEATTTLPDVPSMVNANGAGALLDVESSDSFVFADKLIAKSVETFVQDYRDSLDTDEADDFEETPAVSDHDAERILQSQKCRKQPDADVVSSSSTNQLGVGLGCSCCGFGHIVDKLHLDAPALRNATFATNPKLPNWAWTLLDSGEVHPLLSSPLRELGGQQPEPKERVSQDLHHYGFGADVVESRFPNHVPQEMVDASISPDSRTSHNTFIRFHGICISPPPGISYQPKLVAIYYCDPSMPNQKVEEQSDYLPPGLTTLERPAGPTDDSTLPIAFVPMLLGQQSFDQPSLQRIKSKNTNSMVSPLRSLDKLNPVIRCSGEIRSPHFDQDVSEGAAVAKGSFVGNRHSDCNSAHDVPEIHLSEVKVLDSRCISKKEFSSLALSAKCSDNGNDVGQGAGSPTMSIASSLITYLPNIRSSSDCLADQESLPFESARGSKDDNREVVRADDMDFSNDVLQVDGDQDLSSTVQQYTDFEKSETDAFLKEQLERIMKKRKETTRTFNGIALNRPLSPDGSSSSRARTPSHSQTEKKHRQPVEQNLQPTSFEYANPPVTIKNGVSFVYPIKVTYREPKWNLLPENAKPALQNVWSKTGNSKDHIPGAQEWCERREFQCLRPPMSETEEKAAHINANVIDGYLSLIKEKRFEDPSKLFIWCFATQDYVFVKENERRKNKWIFAPEKEMFEHDLIVLPFVVRNHWRVMICHIDTNSLHYFDSWTDNEPGTPYLELFERFLATERKRQRQPAVIFKKFTRRDIPLQSNKYDCGMFLLSYVDCLQRNVQFDFSQSDMPDIRGRIAYELLTNQLVPR